MCNMLHCYTPHRGLFTSRCSKKKVPWIEELEPCGNPNEVTLFQLPSLGGFNGFQFLLISSGTVEDDVF